MKFEPKNFPLFFFVSIYVLGLLMAGVEAFTYDTFFSSRFWLSLSLLKPVILLAGVFFVITSSTSNLRPKYLFWCNRLFVIGSVILMLLLVGLENLNYPNFVFSRFHLHPTGVKAILELVFLMLSLEISNYILHTGQLRRALSIQLVLITCGFYLAHHLSITLETMARYAAYPLMHPTASLEQKMESKIPLYTYFNFIKSHTPETAVVAVPPKRLPWLTVGNTAYVKYFLYPRTVVTSNDEQPIPLTADYITLAKGSWAVNDATEYGWPKVLIENSSYWTFDSNNKSITFSSNNFDPSRVDNSTWGIIKLTK